MWLFHGCVCIEMFKRQLLGLTFQQYLPSETFMDAFDLVLVTVQIQEFSLHVQVVMLRPLKSNSQQS